MTFSPSSGSAADTALTSHAAASPDDTRPAVRVEAATSPTPT